MADPVNNSFIPKRGPAKQKRQANSRKVYLFTLISYIMIFASLLASAGVYIYERYMNDQLDAKITELNTAIQTFSEADMQRVMEFDRRLQQASGRLDSSVSLVSIFDALEAATIDTVQVESLTMDRQGDELYELTAVVNTDSFDSTIFQRGVYQRNPSIATTTVSSVVAAVGETAEGESASSDELSRISFTATLEVPITAVPYDPTATPVSNEPLTITGSSDAAVSDTDEVNEADI